MISTRYSSGWWTVCNSGSRFGRHDHRAPVLLLPARADRHVAAVARLTDQGDALPPAPPSPGRAAARSAAVPQIATQPDARARADLDAQHLGRRYRLWQHLSDLR